MNRTIFSRSLGNQLDECGDHVLTPFGFSWDNMPISIQRRDNGNYYIRGVFGSYPNTRAVPIYELNAEQTESYKQTNQSLTQAGGNAKLAAYVWLAHNKLLESFFKLYKELRNANTATA